MDAPSETPMLHGNCQRIELKRERETIDDGNEPYQVPVKKLVVEALCEDIRSEVSNPIASSKETASTFQDITSQPSELLCTNLGGCSDETSKVSGALGSHETLNNEVNGGNCAESRGGGSPIQVKVSQETLSNEVNGGNCAASSGRGPPIEVKISDNSGSEETLNREVNVGNYAGSSDKGSPLSVKVSGSSDSEATLSNEENVENYSESSGKLSPGSVKVSDNSVSEVTLTNEDNGGNYAESSGRVSLGSVTKSCVVLEIPEHASTTGVRKIKFKFSERKDLVSQPSNGVSDNVPHRNPKEEQEQDYLTFDRTSLEAHATTYQSGCTPIGNFHPCAPNMELKMSKKVVPDGFPTNVKKLLSTGILDGARVKYVPVGPGVCHLLMQHFSFSLSTFAVDNFQSFVFIGKQKCLEGIISGGGYLCGCSLCNFSRVRHQLLLFLVEQYVLPVLV